MTLFSQSAPQAAHASTDPWASVERFDFNSALHSLAERGADQTASDARLRLAHAAALLGAQPRTPENIDDALALAGMIETDASLAPDLRLTATYLRGRILREHLEPRSAKNLAAARDAFRRLVDCGSDHPLALRATVSLAFCLLDDEPERPAAERLAAAEALIPRASVRPAVERDLRYVIAQAALRWKLDPAIAREHLRRVEQIGFSQLPRRLAVRVSLGRVAEETGDHALAAHAYRAFLAEAVRDHRETVIREGLAKAEAHLSAAAHAAPATASAPIHE